ncbi:exported hypothetical protein [Candidatus Accumulibacter aalborgensis]|uniref:histidine kinase n=1 Tax=Candidatus Accumulibacter aalborgensis TaxID=1860102 RepID=A0A1A8XDH4_9PROT|nr:exported hypothetical protein [Candidatus Accumulibacter aalborgensis]
MLRSLYGKLAIVLMLLFFAIGAAFIAATEQMLEGRRLLELAADLIIGAIAFSLLAALIVFNLLTRRLRLLAAQMDAFRARGLSQPTCGLSANPEGDEIDRLVMAFQEMSDRMAAQVRALEQSEEQRRELLANVSHDLRTPLASMQGYLEILLLKHGTLPAEEERSYLEIAAKHSDRLGKLVRDLFELTKLEAHDILLMPRTCWCASATPAAELRRRIWPRSSIATTASTAASSAARAMPVSAWRSPAGSSNCTAGTSPWTALPVSEPLFVSTCLPCGAPSTRPLDREGAFAPASDCVAIRLAGHGFSGPCFRLTAAPVTGHTLGGRVEFPVHDMDCSALKLSMRNFLATGWTVARFPWVTADSQGRSTPADYRDFK